ncbi:MAG: hypothetical protein HOP29_06125 [Phycisphaerales bacterium]|nr:hypothetical protein [Phycisphaerales bacterium]
MRGQIIDQPPIYNDRNGSPPNCFYAGNVGAVCGTLCRCSPTVGGTGWSCDGSEVSGRWPVFSLPYYVHSSTLGGNFIDWPLLDLTPVDAPTGLLLQQGTQTLIPDNRIALSPIARLDRIREVPLE